MTDKATRIVFVTGLAVWTKHGSSKVWVEAGKKWAHVIVNFDAWAIAKLIAIMVPNPVGAVIGPLIMAIAKWHAGRLKKYVGPNGVWIGIDPKSFMSLRPADPRWWKKIDAHARTKQNQQKEPSPW